MDVGYKDQMEIKTAIEMTYVKSVIKEGFRIKRANLFYVARAC